MRVSGLGPVRRNSLLGVTHVLEHALGHPIVQPLRDPRELGRGYGPGELIDDSVLNPACRAEPADPQNVRGLRGPGRDRAQPRHHQQLFSGNLGRERRGLDDLQQALGFLCRQRPLELEKVAVVGSKLTQPGRDPLQLGQPARVAERGQRVFTAKS